MLMMQWQVLNWKINASNEPCQFKELSYTQRHKYANGPFAAMVRDQKMGWADTVLVCGFPPLDGGGGAMACRAWANQQGISVNGEHGHSAR